MSNANLDILALIPARGGSKGVPRKNLVQVVGRPLIAYSIEHALQSRRITRTIVSTDDDEIAEVSRRCGAEVPFLRPAEYATDLATDLQVFRHALLALLDREGYLPDLVVQLRPTSPVRRPEVVDRAIDALLAAPGFDSLKSVSVVEKSPYKMWIREGDGLVPLLTLPGVPEAHSVPRQMLPSVYVGNAYVDIIRPTAILDQNSMVGTSVLPFVVDEPSFDLDHIAQLPGIERALVSATRTSWTSGIAPNPLADTAPAT